MTQKIKFSSETITILKNLSGINKSLIFRPGNVLYTMSEAKSIMVKATVSETFESEFAIFDVNRLLAMMSHFSDPELTINDKFLTIAQDKRKLNYVFADPRHILTVDEEMFKKLAALTDKADAQFDWKNEVFQDVKKARLIMGLPEFQVSCNGTDVILRAIDTENPTSDVYEAIISEGDAVFSATFNEENIKLLPLDYAVKYSSRGIAKFESEKVTYLVTAEAKKK